jgi:acetylornithine/N-succinyldiaminopimelate aminotransferase
LDKKHNATLGRQFMQLADNYIFHTYNRFPVVLEKGKGCRVWDTEGKEYLDMLAGLAVCNLGHCHPKLVAALCDQASKLMHVSNLYHIEPQIKLAELLCAHSFADKVFFCNSGAEANEAAIKLARKYAKEKCAAECWEIITMNKSFHGRTMATITATAQEKFHKGFEPLLPGFKYVPFGDLAAVEAAIGSNTAALMLEPIQGEGGVNMPLANYLSGLRKLCDERNLLLILDEVQTGIGRTGLLFAYEHYGIRPDIMTLAKALGGGVAMGAMLATDEVAEVFGPGSHASTFGGNPLACAAGLATINTILEDGLLNNCQQMGQYLLTKLNGLKDKYPIIKEVRGKGLMLGVELELAGQPREGQPIVLACLEKGVLLNCTMGNVLRFLPPLIIGPEEVHRAVTVLDEVLAGQSA